MSASIAQNVAATLPTTGAELQQLLKRGFETIQTQYRRQVKDGRIKNLLTLPTDKITPEHLLNVCYVCYPDDTQCRQLADMLQSHGYNADTTDNADRQSRHLKIVKTDNADITDTLNRQLADSRQEADMLKNQLADSRQLADNLNTAIEKIKAEHKAELKSFILKLEKNAELLQFKEKELQKTQLEADRHKQTLQLTQTDRETKANILTDITDKHNRQLTDITDKHRQEIDSITDKHSRQLTDITDKHRQDIDSITAQLTTMTDKFKEAQMIIQTQNGKKSFFQLSSVVLVCFVGVVAYQSYETSLGLLKFHTVAGKEVPYFVAWGCAALVGLFGIILTMNTPKNEWNEYNLGPLRNYEIGVFLLNLYVFLPDVINAPGTHWQDYIATALYCASMPFIEYTFGNIYLSKKQDEEDRIKAVAG